MLDFLPAKYDKKWYWIWAILAFVLWGILIGCSILLLGKSVNISEITGMFMISAMFSFFICLAGFLAAKIMFICLSMGLFCALIMMGSAYLQRTGWEDIIGFILFMGTYIVGFGVGIVGEGAAFIMRKYKGNRLR